MAWGLSTDSMWVRQGERGGGDLPVRRSLSIAVVVLTAAASLSPQNKIFVADHRWATKVPMTSFLRPDSAAAENPEWIFRESGKREPLGSSHILQLTERSPGWALQMESALVETTTEKL